MPVIVTVTAEDLATSCVRTLTMGPLALALKRLVRRGVVPLAGLGRCAFVLDGGSTLVEVDLPAEAAAASKLFDVCEQARSRMTPFSFPLDLPAFLLRTETTDDAQA